MKAHFCCLYGWHITNVIPFVIEIKCNDNRVSILLPSALFFLFISHLRTSNWPVYMQSFLKNRKTVWAMTLNKDTTGSTWKLMPSKVGYNWIILFISFPGKASFSIKQLNMCLSLPSSAVLWCSKHNKSKQILKLTKSSRSSNFNSKLWNVLDVEEFLGVGVRGRRLK